MTLPPPTATLPPPTATALPSPTPAVYQPEFESATCGFEIPAGARVRCGFLTVPEDRRGVLTDTIRLAVAVYHGRGVSRASDPVIFLQGGPGSGAVASLTDYFESFIRPVTRERDLVVFDQRGTGLSQPALGCIEVVSLYLRDMQENLPGDQRGRLYAEALSQCRERLVQGGANPAAYTTAASAADIRDLAEALGYQQVNLYSLSYGTRLAQTVMRDYPEIVRSAVLDSVVPLEVKIYNDEASLADQSLNTRFAGCAAQPECNAAYPDLKSLFYDLQQELDTRPITVSVADTLGGQPYDVPVDGLRLLSNVIWALHSSTMIPLVPRALSAIRAGDYSALEYALSLPTATYAGTSLGTLASVNCHEQVWATTPAELAEAFAPLAEPGAAALHSLQDAFWASTFQP